MTSATAPNAFRVTVLATLAAVALAACGGGGELPDDPQEAVVAAVENRVDGGHSATFGFEVSDRALELAREEDPQGADIIELLQGDVVTYTVDGEKFGFALQVGDDQPLQLRNLGDAFYILVDIPTFVERFDTEGTINLDEVRQQAQGASVFLGNLAPLLDAWFEGRWGGIVEIPDNPGEQASEAFADVLPPELQEQIQPSEAPTELLQELGFDSLQSFVETYVQVDEGSDGRYQASLRARALAEAFFQLAQQANPMAMSGVPGGPTQEDLAEIPETIGGLVVEVEGDQISRVELDPVAVARALGETDTDGLEEGDVVLSLTFADPDSSLLEEPDDAETLTFEELLDTLSRLGQLAQQFMGGFGASASASDSAQVPPPSEFPSEFATELPSEFATELPSGFPTEQPTQ